MSFEAVPPVSTRLNQGQIAALALAVKGAPLEEILEAIVHAMEGVSTRGALASVLLLDDDGKTLRHGAAPSLPDAYNAAVDGIAIGPTAGSCGSAAYLGETVFAEDLATDPRWVDFRDVALTHGLRSCWSTPIRSSTGRVLGTFAVYGREPGAPSPVEDEAVRILAHTAAIIIERHRETLQRQVAQEALDDATRRSQRIIDSVPGLISYLDPQGRYVLVNKAYEDWFGPRDSFLGKEVKDVLGPEAWAIARPRLERALAGERVKFENHVRIKEGTVRCALTAYAPDLSESGEVRGVIVLVTDITDHKRADDQERFLWDLAEATKPLVDADDIVQTTARMLAEFLDVDRCAYANVERESVFEITGDYTRGVSTIVGRWEVKSFGYECQRLMLANEPYVVHDVARDPRVSAADLPAYRATSIASVICVPLHKKGRFTAAMAVHSRIRRQWSDEEVDLVRTVVARCWEALQRANALRLLQDSEARYRTLFESIDEGFLLAEVIRDGDRKPVDLLYLAANPAAVRMLGADYAGRRLLDIDPSFEPYWLEIWGRVADTQNGERHRRYAAPLGLWFDFYVFPAGVAGGRVAVVFQDVTATKASEDAQHHRSVRQAFIVGLADTLRDIDDPAETERTTTKLLGEHLGVSRAYYTQFDEATGLAHVRHDHAVHGDSIAGTYRVADWAMNRELRRGHPVHFADVAKVPWLSAEDALRYVPLDIRSILCVPLVKSGRLVAVFAVAHHEVREWSPQDISLVAEVAERTWAAVERAKAEAALRTADRRKDEFLATLGHELRNPLAPLRNGLEIARLAGRGDPRQERTLDMMGRQLTHLVRLVDDLLDVGRIHAGKIELRREPLLLRDVLAAAIEATRPQIEAHQQTLRVAMSHPEVWVRGDFDRLVQVFNNLLSNAAKYSRGPGHVDIGVRVQGERVEVRVTDAGIGIPPGELAHVFDLFSQVRAHQGRSEGGLGIGLSLVRTLVGWHGGTVSAHSDGPGTGSSFTVDLPAIEAPDTEPAEQATSVEPPAREGLTVLIVDDNVDAAESLAALLELLGHGTHVAHDGEQALAAVERVRPALVFLDLGMPVMDGFTVARRIRSLPVGQGIRLVAMTGWGQQTDRDKTSAAGFDRHMVKPAELSDIEAVLAELAPRTASHQR